VLRGGGRHSSGGNKRMNEQWKNGKRDGQCKDEEEG